MLGLSGNDIGMIVGGGLFVLVGLYMVIASLLHRETTFNTLHMRQMADLVGQTCTRILFFHVGVVVIAIGIGIIAWSPRWLPFLRALRGLRVLFLRLVVTLVFRRPLPYSRLSAFPSFRISSFYTLLFATFALLSPTCA